MVHPAALGHGATSARRRQPSARAGAALSRLALVMLVSCFVSQFDGQCADEAAARVWIVHVRSLHPAPAAALAHRWPPQLDSQGCPLRAALKHLPSIPQKSSHSLCVAQNPEQRRPTYWDCWGAQSCSNIWDSSGGKDLSDLCGGATACTGPCAAAIRAFNFSCMADSAYTARTETYMTIIDDCPAAYGCMDDRYANYGVSYITQRPVDCVDMAPPVLTVAGSDPENLLQLCGLSYQRLGTCTPDGSQVYTDPAFTAIDEVDGDISGDVNASGAVDLYVAAAYSRNYLVEDAAGNAATQDRSIVVEGTGCTERCENHEFCLKTRNCVSKSHKNEELCIKITEKRGTFVSKMMNIGSGKMNYDPGGASFTLKITMSCVFYTENHDFLTENDDYIATHDAGICQEYIFGCMDDRIQGGELMFFNYKPSANVSKMMNFVFKTRNFV